MESKGEKKNEYWKNIKLGWVVTVWPKWQIVIPKDIRDEVGINPGDSVAVLVKQGKYIGIVKNEHMWEIMKYVENDS